MITTRNAKGNKVYLYYSRYGYKQTVAVDKEVLFKGNLKACPKELLEGVPEDLLGGTKYGIVWKEH